MAQKRVCHVMIPMAKDERGRVQDKANRQSRRKAFHISHFTLHISCCHSKSTGITKKRKWSVVLLKLN